MTEMVTVNVLVCRHVAQYEEKTIIVSHRVSSDARICDVLAAAEKDTQKYKPWIEITIAQEGDAVFNEDGIDRCDCCGSDIDDSDLEGCELCDDSRRARHNARVTPPTE